MYKFIFANHAPITTNDRHLPFRLNLRPVAIYRRSNLTGKFFILKSFVRA